jgi:signal transduction histidine kinase/ActR/RegA family two-component response regulator
MNERSITPEALNALDIVALERNDDGSFAAVGRPPEWFRLIFPDDDFKDSSPFLEDFLTSIAELGYLAASTGSRGAAKQYSGVWTQRDTAGAERGLEAWAVHIGGRLVLLVRLLGEEFEIRRAAVQQAHETSLSFERLGQFTSGLADSKLQLELRNREVERLNQLKSEFLASMSHELRTPLNAILGFSSLLLEQSAGPLNTDQQSYVTHVMRASRHLLELINDILDLSKIEAGRIELAPEAFPLQEALDEVLSTIQPLARDKGIRLATGDCAGLQVYADRLRFKQILYNLLSNAIKFTPEKGNVRLDASLKDDQLTIAVTDTGIGIPREEQDAIFEKFHQVGGGTKGIREGTGLGLSITKRLVEQHGGEIRVYSEPGLGSRFVFTLPHQSAKHIAPAADGRAKGSQAGAESQGPRRRIAVVEDNSSNRALFEAMLKPFYQVVSYPNGVDALAAFRRERPDLVLLDIALPAMNGMEVLRRMRADPSLRLIPVIAVSAHAMSGYRDKLLADGFNEYIAKPVTDRAVLLRAIEPLLQGAPHTDKAVS